MKGLIHLQEGESYYLPRLNIFIFTDLLACIDSGATMEACVQNLAKFSGSGLGPAILCATKHPAEMLGGEIAQKKGNLRPGSDADLVLLDRDKGTVLRTWILGREVYCRKE